MTGPLSQNGPAPGHPLDPFEQPAVWSHRGRTGPGDDRIENTVAAFESASALGVDGIELDVWQTADGAWVVHHDRETVAGPLDRLERRAVPESIPGLADALAACRVAIANVELKVPREATSAQAGRLGTELAKELNRLRGGGPFGELLLSSFSPDAARAAAATDRNLRVGLLLAAGPPVPFEPGRAAGFWGVHAFHQLLSPASIATAHAHGLRTVAWTVDDSDEMLRLAGGGIDVIISNQAALAQRVLAQGRPRPDAG